MTNRSIFKGIRAKINLALVPAIIPMLAIAFIGYNSFRVGAIENSERLLVLSLENGGYQLESFLEDRHQAFAGWAADDVWAVSIDYEMIGDLGMKLADITADSPEFALMLVVDPEGRILTGGRDGSSDVGDLLGDTCPDFQLAPAESEPDGSMAVNIVSGPWMDKALSGQSQTIVYSSRLKNMGDQTVGYLMGYLDWNRIHELNGSLAAALPGVGFPRGVSALVDNDTGRVLSWTAAAESGQDNPSSMGDLKSFLT